MSEDEFPYVAKARKKENQEMRAVAFPRSKPHKKPHTGTTKPHTEDCGRVHQMARDDPGTH